MLWSVRVDGDTGKEYLAVNTRGRPILLDPITNKGSAFTAEERASLRLHGLLPPSVNTMEEQLERAYEAFKAKSSGLEQYTYLSALHDRNETLFFRLVHEHVDEMMPIIYAPIVGQACQEFSHIFRRARGLYVSIDNQDEIENVLAHASRPPAVIVVTDGERILGLGDQGADGMGIPIGKLCLYTLCAGVPPYFTLPVMLDAGTDNAARLSDPLYLGLRRPRARGREYQEFVNRFVEGVQKVFPSALLQWEDFLKENAIRQLDRFQNRMCTFNDDIQGTGAVVLAGILAALRLTRKELTDQRVVLAGAGAAAHGIATLLGKALCEAGLSPRQARNRIWMVDSKGLVTKARPDLEDSKAVYARDIDEIGGYRCDDHSRITLMDTVVNTLPSVLIGTSGKPEIFTQPIIERMSAFNERPIVFPLSNPTSKSEGNPQQILHWSRGRAIIATGSPFPPATIDGRTHRIGQGNNAFIFPGVGLGAWVAGIRRINDRMFLEAARALAGMVRSEDLASSSVFPELDRIRACSHAVACAVIRAAVADGLANEEQLEDVENRVQRAMWFPEYRAVRYERHAGWWSDGSSRAGRRITRTRSRTSRVRFS